MQVAPVGVKNRVRPASLPICLAGMHRSGTSLLASYLQQAGLPIGEDLLPPNHDNVKGFFEDRDFYDWHESVLYHNQSGLMAPKTDFQFSKDHLYRALEMVRNRRAKHDFWAWKDPRSVLFLEWWDHLTGGEMYVIGVYRPAVQVIDSLLRRATDEEVVTDSMTAGFAWVHYNALLVDFLESHPERSYLVPLESFLTDPEKCRVALAERLGTPLQPVSFQHLFESSLLQSTIRHPQSHLVAAFYAPSIAAINARFEKILERQDQG